MSAEGDRGSGLLEDHPLEHHRLHNTPPQASESSGLIPEDIQLETKGHIIEKLASLLVFSLALLMCCLFFVIVIFSLVQFIQTLSTVIAYNTNVTRYQP